MKSLFKKLLVVQMPPLYIKPKLEQAEAEAREDVEADAEDETTSLSTSIYSTINLKYRRDWLIMYPFK